MNRSRYDEEADKGHVTTHSFFTRYKKQTFALCVLIVVFVVYSVIHDAHYSGGKDGTQYTTQYFTRDSSPTTSSLLTSSSSSSSLNLPTTEFDLRLREQSFFCTISPFLTLKETVEKHVIFGTSISFLMFLLPFGRDIVSTEIHAHRGWDNIKTREMLRIMQGHRPRLNYSKDYAEPFVRTPEEQMTLEESQRVFLDIGANIGWFTLNIAAGGYRVISFEPLQHNEIALRSSICRNSGFINRVRYYNYGLSDKSEYCAVYSDSKNVGDGHVVCRSEEEREKAKRIIKEEDEKEHEAEKIRNEETIKKQKEKEEKLAAKIAENAASAANAKRLRMIKLNGSGTKSSPSSRSTLSESSPSESSPSSLPSSSSNRHLNYLTSPPPATQSKLTNLRVIRANDIGHAEPLFGAPISVTSAGPVAAGGGGGGAEDDDTSDVEATSSDDADDEPIDEQEESRKLKDNEDDQSIVAKQARLQAAIQARLSGSNLKDLASGLNAHVAAAAAATVPTQTAPWRTIPVSTPNLYAPTIKAMPIKSTYPITSAAATGGAASSPQLPLTPPPPPLSSTALIRLNSLSLTREWNTTGLIPAKYFIRNELRVHRLDSIVKEEIWLMKIDVEGYEAHVLQGSSGLFDNYHVRYIVAEYSPYMLERKGSKAREGFLEFFHQRGYEIRHIQKGFNIDEKVEVRMFDSFCRVNQTELALQQAAASAGTTIRRKKKVSLNRQCELFMARPEDIDMIPYGTANVGDV